MIKKSLAAVALVFVIIFAGSQSNIAEAEEVYIGYMGDWINGAEGRNGDGYLLSESVRGNYDTLVCILIIKSQNIGTYYGEYTFKKGINRWAVRKEFRGGGGGMRFSFTYNLTEFDKKLLSYIINNYDV